MADAFDDRGCLYYTKKLETEYWAQPVKANRLWDVVWIICREKYNDIVI